ncbi:hypothetical protein ACLB2K_023614 [Fragaria x ananassa]
MPNLQYLWVECCMELKTVPLGLEYLSYLQTLELGFVPMEVIESIRKGGLDRSKAIAIPEEEPKKSRSRESLPDWEGHRQEARRAAARATSETARGKSDWREARATGEKSRPRASQRLQRMKGFGDFGVRRGCE